MKFKILLFITVVASACFTSCDDDDYVGNWVDRSFYEGIARGEGSSFELDDYGYFGMGQDDDDYFSDFWKYDPVQNTWTEVAEFPGTQRAYNVSVSTDTKGYVGLGYNGDDDEDGNRIDDLSDFWEYDATTNEWTQIEDFAGGARRYATAFSIDNDIYVGTGTSDDDDVFHNDFYKYDGSSWTKIASLSGEKRKKANAVSLNGIGYVLSGLHNSTLQDFWSYDPATDTWTEMDDLDDDDTGDDYVARYNAATYGANEKIYLIAGNRSGGTVYTAFEWDPSDEDWTQKTSMESAIGREGAGYFVLNDIMYIVGGHSGSSYKDDCYMFQPDAEEDEDD